MLGSGLGVDTVKSQAVDDGERIASTFTSIFLILGLFSIMAGILLIVLIFTMLAAERRSEMGMARAVGTQRKQLIQQFIAEGAGYALLAGIVGSALGVVASIGIANGMKLLFGQFFEVIDAGGAELQPIVIEASGSIRRPTPAPATAS